MIRFAPRLEGSVCVWVSGASLDSLSPGPQRRHRGRLQRVSLRRDARGRSFHVSAKRELTLKRNRQLDTKNVARPAHAGPGLIMPRPTRASGDAHVAASATHRPPPRGRRSVLRPSAASSAVRTHAHRRRAPRRADRPGVGAAAWSVLRTSAFSLTLRPRGARRYLFDLRALPGG